MATVGVQSSGQDEQEIRVAAVVDASHVDVAATVATAGGTTDATASAAGLQHAAECDANATGGQRCLHFGRKEATVAAPTTTTTTTTTASSATVAAPTTTTTTTLEAATTTTATAAATAAAASPAVPVGHNGRQEESQLRHE